MKTKSLSIFLVALFVVEMNLGAEEDKNEKKEDEKFGYKIISEDVSVSESDLCLKMILIGNSMVGKSALCEKICRNKFSDVYNATVGFEFFNLNFRILSDKKEPVLKYQIWDCCGQKAYKSLISSFYGNASVFLLAYDVTDEKSFKDIDGWVNEVKSKNTVETIPFVLIGTKIDLNDDRKVTEETGKNFAEKNGMKFVEVSAKTGDGLEKLKDILAKIIYEEFKKKNVIDENNEKMDKKIIEDGIEYDSIMEEKHTRSSSLCDCCKDICGIC